MKMLLSNDGYRASAPSPDNVLEAQMTGHDRNAITTGRSKADNFIWSAAKNSAKIGKI